MKQLVKGILGLGALMALASCQDPVEKVVRQNLEGFQQQNVEKIMATVDDRSPAFEGTKKQVDRLLQDYNLDFKIESLTIIEKPDDEKKAIEKAAHEAEDTTELDEAIDGFVTEDQKAAAEHKHEEEEKANARRPLIARVKVVQVTRAKSSDEQRFLNNRVQVVHTLHKYPTDEKPEWKIYKSDIRAVDILPTEES